MQYIFLFPIIFVFRYQVSDCPSFVFKDCEIEQTKKILSDGSQKIRTSKNYTNPDNHPLKKKKIVVR